MKKVEEYLHHPAECREMARTATQHHRQQLEDMAKTWEQLAQARERQMQKRNKDKKHSGARVVGDAPA